MNNTEISTMITEGLVADQQIKVTMKETGMTRQELSEFVSDFLSECTCNYVGDSVFADATIDGFIIYEY
ncbi:hypothetical protein [Paenibacillus sp. NPDC057967]|uniref:hypothetical protein n=1 Tax=Paenibacillus sp. NPDC057967 TaxID=3346293 RepID=UPI0036D92E06